jgi:prevent-host-death family protein
VSRISSTCATLAIVLTTGLRELRQNASDLIRRVEGGATIRVTVSGRDVAEIRPIQRDHWRRAVDATSVFIGPADAAWPADRDRIADEVRDPFG